MKFPSKLKNDPKVVTTHVHRIVDGGVRTQPNGSKYAHDHVDGSHEDASIPHHHNAHGLDVYIGQINLDLDDTGR